MILHVLWIVMALGQAQPDQARPVELKFENGRVWVTARRATLAQILSAWTRTGKTKFEGVEKAPAQGPIDVQLTGVTEDEALKVLLKQAGGYTAVVRDLSPPVESTFARVVILASRSPGAPAVTPVAEPAPPEPQEPPPPAPGSAIQPVLGPDGLPIPDDQQDAPFRSMPPGFDNPPEPPPPPTSPTSPSGANRK